MKITRRQAVVAALSSMIALETNRNGKAADEDKTKFFTSPDNVVSVVTKGQITFSLDGFTKYEFHLGGRVVTITPEEMMDALEGK